MSVRELLCFDCMIRKSPTPVVLSSHEACAHLVPLEPDFVVRLLVDMLPREPVAVVLVSEDAAPLRVHDGAARLVPDCDPDEVARGTAVVRRSEDGFGAEGVGRVEDALEAAGVAEDADVGRWSPVGGLQLVVKAVEHGNIALGLRKTSIERQDGEYSLYIEYRAGLATRTRSSLVSGSSWIAGRLACPATASSAIAAVCVRL